jgi:hypothetical protein
MTWEPEPAQLREGEVPDLDTHARRNLEQIKQGLEDELIEREDVKEEFRRHL